MNRVLTLIAALTISLTSSADASYLYWTSTSTNAGRTNTCLSFAQSTLSYLGYQGIRVTKGLEVSGSKAGVYVAVTCIGTRPRATAMVMAVGDDGNLVNKLQAEVALRVSKVICFDTCD
ncbi:hypothetical protein EHF33_07250 [Deinococcus psychrotolerans]|uniref:Uncharacterized protein n=1 Tax=Deinococcus psychrotolerans TaxID=2489213 RepID=A0A3G8YN48_9DEIO|nr:hypothetical protein [Deinococcus psychrotolerans]AZI42566.1 hypothetical protein EHF33_07250 [Deinococcus psychrotolerans]